MDNFPINMTMSGLSGDCGGCDVAANVMIDGSVSPSTSSGVSSLGSSYIVSGSNGYAYENVICTISPHPTLLSHYFHLRLCRQVNKQSYAYIFLSFNHLKESTTYSNLHELNGFTLHHSIWAI